MLCPACTAPMPEDDAFCEDCGAPLAAKAPIPDCPKCGAGPAEVDADGYCAACGFRRTPHERDHIEIVISPQFAGVTDRGRRHSLNEDFLVLRDGLMVVCDGVSSSQDAMLASKAAAETAANSMEAGRSMKDAIADALAAVVELPVHRGDADAPSTTIVAVRLRHQGNSSSDSAVGQAVPPVVEIAWAGDSRAYWIAPSGSRQLTSDDSWMNDVVSRGEMRAEEARTAPNAHAVTKWLGRDVGEMQASVVEFEFPGPGVLLVCTDGLWNYAPELSDLEALLGNPDEALVAARKLVDYANKRGGVDNVTAALWIRIG